MTFKPYAVKRTSVQKDGTALFEMEIGEKRSCIVISKPHSVFEFIPPALPPDIALACIASIFWHGLGVLVMDAIKRDLMIAALMKGDEGVQ